MKFSDSARKTTRYVLGDRGSILDAGKGFLSMARFRQIQGPTQHLGDL